MYRAVIGYRPVERAKLLSTTSIDSFLSPRIKQRNKPCSHAASGEVVREKRLDNSVTCLGVSKSAETFAIQVQ